MPPTSKPLISQTPAANGAAQDATRNRLVTLLYPELRKLAWRHLNAERADHTLQTTALVNEVFLEIARDETNRWADRAHFLAAASQIMRRVLIDYARRRCASKRGGGAVRIELEADDLPDTFEYSRLIELNQLLDQLAAEQPRMAQVVEMRCFGGLDCKEIGSALGIDERTVKRDWQFAKAWLAGQRFREVKERLWYAISQQNRVYRKPCKEAPRIVTRRLRPDSRNNPEAPSVTVCVP